MTTENKTPTESCACGDACKCKDQVSEDLFKLITRWDVKLRSNVH